MSRKTKSLGSVFRSFSSKGHSIKILIPLSLKSSRLSSSVTICFESELLITLLGESIKDMARDFTPSRSKENRLPHSFLCPLCSPSNFPIVIAVSTCKSNSSKELNIFIEHFLNN